MELAIRINHNHSLLIKPLYQGSSTRSPRAACGPQNHSLWTADIFQIYFLNFQITVSWYLFIYLFSPAIKLKGGLYTARTPVD
jgi:hypothetical protein